MSTALMERQQLDAQTAVQVLARGDLVKMNDEQRLQYYNAVCQSLDLNPLTRPFEFLVLDKKLVLYARKDCTEQLRAKRDITLTIIKREERGELYFVTAKATLPNGRSDEAEGVVSLCKEDGEWVPKDNGDGNYFRKNGKMIPLTGDALANAYMKAETKAKRRVTLSICGLGWLDETEVETIPNAAPVRQIETKPATNTRQPAKPDADFVKNMEKWEGALVAKALCRPREFLLYLCANSPVECRIGEEGAEDANLALWPKPGRPERVTELFKQFQALCLDSKKDVPPPVEPAANPASDATELVNDDILQDLESALEANNTGWAQTRRKLGDGYPANLKELTKAQGAAALHFLGWRQEPAQA